MNPSSQPLFESAPVQPSENQRLQQREQEIGGQLEELRSEIKRAGTMSEEQGEQMAKLFTEMDLIHAQIDSQAANDPNF
jgi:hypothetical protein